MTEGHMSTERRETRYPDGSRIVQSLNGRNWIAYWADGTELRGGDDEQSYFETHAAAAQALIDGGEGPANVPSEQGAVPFETDSEIIAQGDVIARSAATGRSNEYRVIPASISGEFVLPEDAPMQNVNDDGFAEQVFANPSRNPKPMSHEDIMELKDRLRDDIELKAPELPAPAPPLDVDRARLKELEGKP